MISTLAPTEKTAHAPTFQYTLVLLHSRTSSLPILAKKIIIYLVKLPWCKKENNKRKNSWNHCKQVVKIEKPRRFNEKNVNKSFLKRKAKKAECTFSGRFLRSAPYWPWYWLSVQGGRFIIIVSKALKDAEKPLLFHSQEPKPKGVKHVRTCPVFCLCSGSAIMLLPAWN